MKKTTLTEVHEKLGAKLIEFAGYMMPVQYSSIIAEHKTVRTSVGVFDVSHMGEIFIKGDKALDFVQHITVNDASKLTIGRVQYSAMCYPEGGIVDDLLVYKLADNEFMLVVNASNKEKDFKWMLDNNKFGVDIQDRSDDYTLLAVQGPKSKDTLQKISSREIDLEYYHFFMANVAGIDMILSRTGYTGELVTSCILRAMRKVPLKYGTKCLKQVRNLILNPLDWAPGIHCASKWASASMAMI